MGRYASIQPSVALTSHPLLTGFYRQLTCGTKAARERDGQKGKDEGNDGRRLKKEERRKKVNDEGFQIVKKNRVAQVVRSAKKDELAPMRRMAAWSSTLKRAVHACERPSFLLNITFHLQFSHITGPARNNKNAGIRVCLTILYKSLTMLPGFLLLFSFPLARLLLRRHRIRMQRNKTLQPSKKVLYGM